MGRKGRIFILCVLWSIALQAVASSVSEVHRTKAISALAEGRLERAIEELDWALQADGSDLHARYYRGIVYSRLGDYERATRDLKAVMEADQPYQKLHFELGYAEFHLERLIPAKAELEVAIGQDADFAPAQYYLGVILYQLKEYESCLVPLARAASLDKEFDASASFMRGDALIYLGRGEEAKSLLNTAIESYPDSIYTDYSRQALRRLEQERRWELELAAGGSFDTNVGLFADDRALPAGIEDEEDWRTQLALDGSYRLWQRADQTLTAGYRFFNSSHDKLSDYDLQNHTLIADYRQEMERLVWGVNLQYVGTLLGGEDYRGMGVFSPYLIWEHQQSRSSFFKLSLTDMRYQQEAQTQWDGKIYGGQYRHYWLRGDNRYLFAGLRIDKDAPKDEEYSYSGYGIEGGFQHRWHSLTLAAELLYQRRNYEGGAPSREDDYGKGGVKLSYPLREGLALESNLILIRNESSNSEYDYSRYVANLMLRWSL